jgi:hypothetical protein
VATRTSEARFLEILEATPTAGVPMEFEVFDGGSPSSYVTTLENAAAGSIQDAMGDVGAGRCDLPSDDPKRSSVQKGDYIRVKIGNVERYGFWNEDPETVLTGPEETLSEVLRLRGRGALAYLERASVYPPTWPVQPVAFGAASSADNGAGATSITVARPAGTKSGSTLIATLTFRGGSDKTLATPAGWKLIDRYDSGNTIGLAIYRRTASGSDTSYAWTFTTATQASVIVVRLEYANADVTAFTLDFDAGSGTAIRSPGVSIGLVDGILLTYATTTADSSSITPPAGLVEAADHGAAGRTIEAAYLLGPAVGDTGDQTAVAAAGGSWIGASLFIPNSGTNDFSFERETFGGILATLIDQAQARGAIPALTYDFSTSVDSNGQPWPEEHTLAFHAGTSLLDVWRLLVSLGLEGRITPSLKLQAFVDMSRHKETEVVLRKGHHLLSEVAKTERYSGLRTRALVEGAGGRIIEVADAALEASDARIGRREGYFNLDTSDDATELQRAGEAVLAQARLDDEARHGQVDHGPSSEGRYEPYVDYRMGDWIGLDAAGDGTIEAQRVVGITVSQLDTPDYAVELDWNSIAVEKEVRLARALAALAGGSTSSGSSGLSYGGSGGGGAASSGTVSVIAGDTPGYLFDKLVAVDPIRKSIISSGTGNRVQLAMKSRSFPYGDEITPPTLTADVDDYAPVGIAGASLMRLASDVDGRQVSGLLAPGPSDSIAVAIANVGTTTWVLRHENASSAAANRFECPQGNDLAVSPGISVLVVYDRTTARWRIVGGTGGGGAALGDLSDVDVPTPSDQDVLTWDSATSKWIAQAGGSPTEFNVMDYGSVGDGTADDTAAINLAIAALNSAGKGVLYFPAGTYKCTAALTTISAACLIRGDGSASFDDGQSISQVNFTGQTGVPFTISAKVARIEKLAVVNTYGGTPTAGSAVLVDSAYLGQRVDFEGCVFQGFYDNVDVKVGAQWIMHGCFSIAPVRYGLRIRNTVNPDAGDWAIIGCNFYAQTYNSTSAIRVESSGGGKIVGCKINKALDSKLFGTGVDIAIASGNDTSVLSIAGCSIENVSGDAIKIATTGTGKFGLATVAAVQVGLYGNNAGYAVNIVAASTGGNVAGGIYGVSIDGCVFHTNGTARAAVAIAKADNVVLGDFAISGFNARYTNAAGTNITDGGVTFATPSISYGTPAAGSASTAIRSDATIAPPDAVDVPLADAGNYFTTDTVEDALQQLGAANASGLLTVDPGTPSYDDSGADVVISLSSKWGYGADGPYYNSAGVTAGEEAILCFDPVVGDFAIRPYNP